MLKCLNLKRHILQHMCPAILSNAERRVCIAETVEQWRWRALECRDSVSTTASRSGLSPSFPEHKHHGNNQSWRLRSSAIHTEYIPGTNEVSSPRAQNTRNAARYPCAMIVQTKATKPHPTHLYASHTICLVSTVLKQPRHANCSPETAPTNVMLTQILQVGRLLDQAIDLHLVVQLLAGPEVFTSQLLLDA